jgi:hypothetical protein
MTNFKVGDYVKTVSVGCTAARIGDICRVIEVEFNPYDESYLTVRCAEGIKRGLEYTQYARRFILYRKPEIKLYGICNFVKTYYK